MCGITGFTNWRHSPLTEPKIIHAMTDTMRRRGPDARGIWMSEHVALGHARLAVIDLAGGTQPMIGTSRSGGTIALTYSGEIYNYVELRSELRRRGHVFHTSSDTEVVLRAFIEWGPDCVERLVGMFAFAVWDDNQQSVTLIRDRMGIKPLYFYRTDAGIVWGSEIKAVLAHPEVPAELDATGIAEIFAMAPNTTPGRSILKGIEVLEPGWMAISTRGHTRLRQYWQWEARPHTDDLPTTITTVRDLLEDAVGSQLNADVPLGALLSGGLDSSAVAALAARAQKGPLRTFAVDYADAGTQHSYSDLHRDRDTPFAEAVAKHIGAQHTTLYVTLNDMIGAHAASLEAMDRPSFSPINVPLYLLFERARSEVTVVLSGEAADEAFGGYHWHDPAAVRGGDWPWLDSYRPLDYLLRPDVADVVQPAAYRRDRYRQALETVAYLPGETGPDRVLRESHHLTDTHYLQFLLERKDRESMGVGLEARVPFADHRLVSYARGIPWEWRRTGNMEKGLLRRAVQDLLPHDVVWRRKSGFPAASQVLPYQEYLRGRMRDLLAEPNASVWHIADRAAVSALLGRSPGDLAEWTTTMHISMIIELNSYLDQNDIRLLG